MRLSLSHPLKESLWSRRPLPRRDNDRLVRFSRFLWRDLLPTAAMLLLLGSLTLLVLDFLQP
jgi:hypothetical protein